MPELLSELLARKAYTQWKVRHGGSCVFAAAAAKLTDVRRECVYHVRLQEHPRLTSSNVQQQLSQGCVVGKSRGCACGLFLQASTSDWHLMQTLLRQCDGATAAAALIDVRSRIIARATAPCEARPSALSETASDETAVKSAFSDL
eukprot:835420-Pleurochrysis_carterae.AAC.7